MRTAFYHQRTIHLADAADGPIQTAYCGARLIGAIDTEAQADCPACIAAAEEQAEDDAAWSAQLTDADIDAEHAAADRLLAEERAEAEAQHAADLAAEQPRQLITVTMSGGSATHAAFLPAGPLPADRADLDGLDTLCGAARKSFSRSDYRYWPGLRYQANCVVTCRLCRRGRPEVDALGQPEPAAPQQSPLHQRAIIEALPMPIEQGHQHVATALAEADRATNPAEPRELIGCEARDLRPGDLIVAAGCQHRDGRGCDHRLYAAFDLLLQDGEQGERMTIWTAIADQEAGQPPRLTLPAGQRLLVQRRLPDWRIAEAPSFAASIIDLAMPELPPLCGPAGNLARAADPARGGDLNSDWTCKRARALWGAHRRAAELQAELARLGRMQRRAERSSADSNDRARMRGLADWIARAFVRYEQLNRRLLRELPPCGHPEALRQPMSVEEALPACTC